MIRKILTVVFTIFISFLLFSCKRSMTHSLVLSEYVEASVSDLNRIKTGTTIELTVAERVGFKLEFLKLNDNIVEVKNNKHSFVIYEDIKVTIGYKQVPIKEDVFYTLNLGNNITANVTNLNKVKEGTNVTLTINIPEGMQIDELRVNDVISHPNQNKFVFMMTEDTKVTVSFKELETVEYVSLVVGKYITTNISEMDKIKVGTTIVITVTNPEFKIIDTFTINGRKTEINNNTYIFNIERDTIISVTFKDISKDKFKLTLPKYVTSDVENPNEILSGTKVILTVADRDGFELVKLTANDIPLKLTNNNVQIIITEDTFIKVEFFEIELKYYSLTLPNGFKSNISDLENIKSNTFIEIEYTNSDITTIKSIKKNGVDIKLTNKKYSFNIEEDTIIEVEYYLVDGEVLSKDQIIRILEETDSKIFSNKHLNRLYFKDEYRSLDSKNMNETDLILDLNNNISKRNFYLNISKSYDNISQSGKNEAILYGENNLLYYLDEDKLTRHRDYSFTNVGISYLLSDIEKISQYYDFHPDSFNDFFQFYFNNYLNRISESDSNKVIGKYIDNAYHLNYQVKGKETVKFYVEMVRMVGLYLTEELVVELFSEEELLNSSAYFDLIINDNEIIFFESDFSIKYDEIGYYGNIGNSMTLTYQAMYEEISKPKEIDIDNSTKEDIYNEKMINIYDGDKLLFRMRVDEYYLEDYIYNHNVLYKEKYMIDNFYKDKELSIPYDFNNVQENDLIYIKYKDIFKPSDFNNYLENEEIMFSTSNYNSNLYYENSDYIIKEVKYDRAVYIYDKYNNLAYMISENQRIQIDSKFILDDYIKPSSLNDDDFMFVGNMYIGISNMTLLPSHNKICITNLNSDQGSDCFEFYDQTEIDKMSKKYEGIDGILKDINNQDWIDRLYLRERVYLDYNKELDLSDVVFQIYYNSGFREYLTYDELMCRFNPTFEIPDNIISNYLTIIIEGRRHKISIDWYESNIGIAMFNYYEGGIKYLNRINRLEELYGKPNFNINTGVIANGILFTELNALKVYATNYDYLVYEVSSEIMNLDELIDYFKDKAFSVNGWALSGNTYIVSEEVYYQNGYYLRENKDYYECWNEQEYFKLPKNEYEEYLFKKNMEYDNKNQELIDVFIDFLNGKIKFELSKDGRYFYNQYYLQINQEKIEVANSSHYIGIYLRDYDFYEPTDVNYQYEAFVSNNLNEDIISIKFNKQIDKEALNLESYYVKDLFYNKNYEDSLNSIFKTGNYEINYALPLDPNDFLKDLYSNEYIEFSDYGNLYRLIPGKRVEYFNLYDEPGTRIIHIIEKNNDVYEYYVVNEETNKKYLIDEILFDEILSVINIDLIIKMSIDAEFIKYKTDSYYEFSFEDKYYSIEIKNQGSIIFSSEGHKRFKINFSDIKYDGFDTIDLNNYELDKNKLIDISVYDNYDILEYHINFKLEFSWGETRDFMMYELERKWNVNFTTIDKYNQLLEITYDGEIYTFNLPITNVKEYGWIIEYRDENKNYQREYLENVDDIKVEDSYKEFRGYRYNSETFKTFIELKDYIMKYEEYEIYYIEKVFKEPTDTEFKELIDDHFKNDVIEIMINGYKYIFDYNQSVIYTEHGEYGYTEYYYINDLIINKYIITDDKILNEKIDLRTNVPEIYLAYVYTINIFDGDTTFNKRNYYNDDYEIYINYIHQGYLTYISNDEILITTNNYKYITIYSNENIVEIPDIDLPEEYKFNLDVEINEFISITFKFDDYDYLIENELYELLYNNNKNTIKLEDGTIINSFHEIQEYFIDGYLKIILV